MPFPGPIDMLTQTVSQGNDRNSGIASAETPIIDR